MAGLLFVYSRSSIHVAKRNAERHRTADKGQISWRNKSQRRHEALAKPEEQKTIQQLIAGTQDNKGKVLSKGNRQFFEHEMLRKRKPDNGGRDGRLFSRARLLYNGWR